MQAARPRALADRFGTAGGLSPNSRNQLADMTPRVSQGAPGRFTQAITLTPDRARRGLI